MSFALRTKVMLMRTLASINTSIDQYFVSPGVQRPAFTKTIAARLSERPGQISLHFYVPNGYKQPDPHSTETLEKEYPLIVNFHGGGFTIEHPEDDGRWATLLVRELDAVVVSVGYRMGPDYPQPVAVEDCVDALHWLWYNQDTYALRTRNTIITGFSAGGNLALTAPMRHYLIRKEEYRSDPHAMDYDGHITGIVTFYPSVNQTISREQKADSNPISKTKGSIGPGLYQMFDDSYYQNLPPEERDSPNLSPALAPKDALLTGLPDRMAIFTCEWDQLLVEGEDFRKELQAMGKIIGGRMIENQPHGFDKRVGQASEERDAMYGEAMEQIKTMINVDWWSRL